MNGTYSKPRGIKGLMSHTGNKTVDSTQCVACFTNIQLIYTYNTTERGSGVSSFNTRLY